MIILKMMMTIDDDINDNVHNTNNENVQGAAREKLLCQLEELRAGQQSKVRNLKEPAPLLIGEPPKKNVSFGRYLPNLFTHPPTPGFL